MFDIQPGTRSTVINGPSYVMWAGNILIGSVWPDAGIIRTSGEWGERLELSGLRRNKKVLLRCLARMYKEQSRAQP